LNCGEPHVVFCDPGLKLTRRQGWRFSLMKRRTWRATMQEATTVMMPPWTSRSVKPLKPDLQFWYQSSSASNGIFKVHGFRSLSEAHLLSPGQG